MSIKDLLNWNLVKTFLGTFIVRILAVGATFASSVLLARSLGVEGFGTYSYVFALVSLLALPAQAGMPTLVLRETAKAKALSDWSKMKGIWLWSGSAVMMISLITYSVALLVQKLFFDEAIQQAGGTSIFALGLITALLIAMGNVRGAALRGLGFVVMGQLPEALIRPLLLVIFLLIAILVNVESNPNSAMKIHLFAAAVAFLIGAWLLIKVKPTELKEVKPDIHMKVWFFSIIPLAMMTGMQVVSGQIDIVMLGLLGTLHDVGVYKVVVSGAALTLFGLQVVTMIITPKLASAFAKKDSKRVQQIASVGSLISFSFTLPLVLVFFFFGAEILRFVFGDDFILGHRALYIIAIGQAINAFFGSSISILTMSNNERFVIKGMILSALSNAILNLCLIPRLGVDGAAISASMSIVVWNLYLWAAIKRQIGVDSTFFWIFMRK
ncbi:hypothetical protein Q674_08390 [Acinetobacter sp. COS3]|uniref:oligosaccharide flippase family protein n=1 Tax=Acinetobacter sp. COS3 TaxID=1397525 RepID=UPI0003B8F30C|nr:polysaccharide biosynthesis C-terminal domain-containing protein [Acinetobacter sp. COS3]ERS03608.1 hypothetical protein Q674_08390 [Acinetobacter sp. COS3]